ncbi:MAG: TraB/GumN family protein [Rhodocyclaceae bacterium]|nr:TraB/GumN family protein [Rhodocyclaceae bacterium]
MIDLHSAACARIARARHVFALLALCLLLPAHAAPALWEVSAPGGGRVWLFGSVHLCSQQCYPLPDAVRQAFEASPALALELDPTAPHTAARVLERGVYAPDDALVRHLDPAFAADLLDRLSKLGLDRDALLRMRVWLIAQLITVASAAQAGYQLEQGIDVWFLGQARSAGKTVLELETPDEQIDSMDGLPDSAQQAMLRQGLLYLDPARMKREMSRLVSAWQRGDVDQLASLIRAETSVDPDTEKVFESVLTRRNGVMAERIAAYLDSGRQVFVVVGAAHLSGRADILVRLAAMGYQVRRAN